ncbi:hypothetical protein EI94DRAFT_1796359 [Lactarius quietus]|nr:hypothetical protein EI94DRAFT_1796359 [Lactarius quietus]
MTKHGSRVDSKRDLTAIHTSYLKRAFDTAAILYGHQKDLRPSFDSSELLRELNFGRAKGNSISFNSIPGLTWEQNAAEGIYLAMYDDDDRFPKEKASRILLLAFFSSVSHGLCISELISELLNRDGKKGRRTGSEYSNIPNAACTRVSIDIERAQEGQAMDVDKKRLVLTTHLTNRYRNDSSWHSRLPGNAAHDFWLAM